MGPVPLWKLTSASRGNALALDEIGGKHMVKRVVDERKTADGIKQATQHKTGGGTSHMVIPTYRTECNLMTC